MIRTVAPLCYTLAMPRTVLQAGLIFQRMGPAVMLALRIVMPAGSSFTARALDVHECSESLAEAREPFLELEIERVPPVFTVGDEVVNIVCVVVAGHCGPLAAGKIVWASGIVDGRLLLNAEGTPIYSSFPSLAQQYMETTLNWPIDLRYLRPGNHTVEIDVFSSPLPDNHWIMSNSISFEVLAEETEELGRSPNGSSSSESSSLPYGFMSSSTLMRCVEASTKQLDSTALDGCQQYLRHRLWAVPTYVTQTELTLVKSISGGTFFGHAVDLSLLSQFPRDQPAPLRGSCAVVGSAGHLSRSNLGAEIDSHDYVIRFNDAPTGAAPGLQHLAHHVGRRTTHRLLHAATSIVEWIQGKDGWLANPDLTEDLIFRGDWQNDLDMFRKLHGRVGVGKEQERGVGEGAGTKRASAARRTGQRKLWMLSTGFHLFVWRWVGSRGYDKVPTSGMLGIMWALQSCESVDTYGFGPLPLCPYAAGNNGQDDACRQHPNADPARGESREGSGSHGVKENAGEVYRYYRNAEAKRNQDTGMSAWALGHSWRKEEELHTLLHNAGLLRRHWWAPP